MNWELQYLTAYLSNPMAPCMSKSKGKAPAQRGRPAQTTSTVPPTPALQPIHGEVLEALQNLWNQI